jgi:hypothetical protein
MKEKPISHYSFSNQREFLIFCATALLLLVLTAFLHLYRIGEILNGFYIDESSIGYKAWSIAETGADEYGIKYPVFFKCFDVYYHDPVVIYFLVPMVKAFGLEKWVVRFPSAFFLLMASFAFYFLGTKYVRNRWICLGGAFVFSILPWVFPLSRTGIGGWYMPMLFGIISGWYFLIDAIGKRSYVSAVVAGLCWSFAMYSQNTGRPIAALMLVCFVVTFNVLLLRRWKVFVLFVLTYIACLVPMIVSVLANPASLTSRFSLLSVWSGSGGLGETTARIFERYFEYYSPAFLFVSGDSANLRHHTGNSGELYIFMLPLIIAGTYCLYKGFSRNAYIRFTALVLAFYPFAAILTIDHMHSARAINGAVVWSVLAMLGAAYVWNKRKIKIFKILLCSLALLSIYEAGTYFNYYFGRYVESSRLVFLAPFVEAFEYSFKNLKPGETLYISASAIPMRINTDFKPFWYSRLLFFGKVPPPVYQKSGIPGDYICAYQGRVQGAGILLRKNTVNIKDESGRIVSAVNPEVIPPNSRLIHKIPISADSEDCIEIYRF